MLLFRYKNYVYCISNRINIYLCNDDITYEPVIRHLKFTDVVKFELLLIVMALLGLRK